MGTTSGLLTIMFAYGPIVYLMPLDYFMTSICVVLLLQPFEPYYQCLCHKCVNKINQICLNKDLHNMSKIASKTNDNTNATTANKYTKSKPMQKKRDNDSSGGNKGDTTTGSSDTPKQPNATVTLSVGGLGSQTPNMDSNAENSGGYNDHPHPNLQNQMSNPSSYHFSE